MKYCFNGKELLPTSEVYHDLIPCLGGVTMKEFFMSAEKCAYAWKTAYAVLDEYFDGLFPLNPPSPAPLSYGHLVCVGAPLSIPEDGEPNVLPFAGSADEGIDILKSVKGKPFKDNELFKHYLDVWNYLKESFPEWDIPFTGFNEQGPVTTAVLMRGQDFFMDLYDEPEKAKELLALITDSTVDFIKAHRAEYGLPPRGPQALIADDFASLIDPRMWPDFVIPYWKRRFEATGGGEGWFLHCENLMPAHLPYLKLANLAHYQPSVSDMLTLKNVKANLDPGIEFDWLLYSYRITDMDDAQIQQWVDETVAAGVTKVRTQLGAYTHLSGKMDRIKAFYKAFDKYKV